MEAWISQSNSGKQTMLSAACALAGLVLVIGFRNFNGFNSNATAGFFLGMLLLDANRFGTKKRLIPFSNIVEVGIGYLGKKSNYVTWYYLVLKLRDGKEYPLFSPGRFFEGGSDRSVVAGWKRRLEGYVAQ